MLKRSHLLGLLLLLFAVLLSVFLGGGLLVVDLLAHLRGYGGQESLRSGRVRSLDRVLPRQLGLGSAAARVRSRLAVALQGCTARPGQAPGPGTPCCRRARGRRVAARRVAEIRILRELTSR